MHLGQASQTSKGFFAVLWSFLAKADICGIYTAVHFNGDESSRLATLQRQTWGNVGRIIDWGTSICEGERRLAELNGAPYGRQLNRA